MLQNDLKNDIEKTLQAHCPEPPEGFAERMDNKAISLMQKKHNQNVNKGRSRYRLPVLVAAAVLVLCFVTAASRDLIIRPDEIRARETTTPLVTALSEGHGEATEGEGLSQEAIEALEVNFPGVADKLKPVNLSCEKQGIRMNVISALVEDDKSWVVYSLQDLEGDRISRFAGMDVDLLGFVGDVPGYYCYLEYKQEDHKVTCVHYEEYDEPYHPVDNHFAFKVEDIGREQVEKIDILPFLKQYAKTSEGVKAPEDASVYSTQGDVKYAWSVKVLEDTNPLNVSLYKDIYLTGIGWIDDQLHVRIQDRQQEKITIGSMSVYPVFLSAAGYFSETGKQCEMDQVEWSSAGDERKDLKEYIFDVRPDEVDKMELAAWADDTVDVTRDVWEVQIPADSILAETENPAATVNAVVENESDVQIKATLWAFFTDWVGQNTNYMLLVCADEWKDRQSDPEQAARELMASRKPDGYIINSISGKDNDPVRTVDLTVQWDAGTYSRHEIPFRLQQVTPQMDAYRVDPDGFETGTEAEPVSKKELVLLTEEEIIRKEISYLEFSYDDLIPINLSMEKQGIRMEVMSGCVKGQDLYILCSLQDLEGRYDGLDMEIEQLFKPDVLRMGYSRPYSNYAENKSFWLFHTEEFAQYQAEDGTIPFGIDMVRFEKDESFDMLPFLEKYGKETEGVNAPENARTLGDKESAEDLKVLDYTNPLDVPLTETAKLAGIGWIDNQLHIQLHTAAENIHTEGGTSFPATSVQVYDPFSSQSGQVVEWDENGDWFNDWYDYGLDIKPEDVEQRWLTAEVRETKGVVDDNWEVQVPIDMLLPETGAEPAAQEEEKTVEPASETQAEPAAENKPAFDAEQYYLDNQLWGYIYSWAGGDVNGMLTYSTSEWKRNTEDPKAYLSGMLENGLPKGIRIDSISGTSADSERTAVCTVQTDRDGTEEYAKYNLIIKREKRGVYYIDSGSLGSREPAEKDPEAEMISLSDESIISRKMERSFPGITEQLKPLNISTEKQGIRLEAVSALVQKQDAWFIFSVEDTENRYPYGITYATVSENTGSQSTYLYSNLLYSNQVEHKNYFVLCPHYSYPVSTVDRDVLLRMTGANAEEDRVWLDMNALIRQYGQTVEGIAAPENTINFMSKTSEDMSGLKVLDYSQPLNIPVCESLTLTGIGWIDGKLHVQFYQRDIDKYISFLGFEQYIPGEKDVYTWYLNSIWYHWEDVNGGWWTEYVIDSFAPDDVDRVCLETEIQQSRNMDIRDNMLAVKIPFSSIWVGDEAGQTWSNAAPKE